jgi:monoamine oxidase
MTKHCIVIGAGLSGLAAAHALAKKNWKVTVLEARNRLGGRVFTFKFHEAPDLYCELGGEWVGRDHDSMIRLCKEFKLGKKYKNGLMPHLFDYSFVERGRMTNSLPPQASPFSKQSNDALDKLKKEYLAHRGNSKKALAWQKALDSNDWWTTLRNRNFATEDLSRRDLVDGTDFGESIRTVGGYAAAGEYMEPGSSNATDEMDFRIEGGNTRLVNALARYVGLANIRTCLEAQSVVFKNGEIIVTARDNRSDEFDSPLPKIQSETFRADACICTVPARVLNDIHFDPPLSTVKSNSANQLQYARIMKTVMLFDNRFWMANKKTRFSCFTDSTSDFLFDSTLLQDGPQGILCSYAIGDKADDLAARGTEALRTGLEQDLSAIFPNARPKILAIERYPWQKDKYTQGSYALYRPGQWFSVRDPLTDGHVLAPKLGFPHGRILFAGEHIADEQGFMEGAVDTGQIAASHL